MPKKNGFIVFMESRRSALLASGQAVTGSLAELVPLCDADWKALPQDEKLRFTEMAKSQNAAIKESGVKQPPRKAKGGQAGGPGPSGQTAWVAAVPPSTGCPLKNDRNPEEFTFEDEEQFQENKQIVREMFFQRDWREQEIVICSFTTLVEPNYQLMYLPGEIGLTAMSIQEGIVDNYARIIDPQPVPQGHGIEAYQTAIKLGLPELGTVEELANLEPLTMIMENFLEMHRANSLPEDESHYVFCFDSDFLFVSRCLKSLLDKARNFESYSKKDLKVLSLDLWAYLAASNGSVMTKTSGAGGAVARHRQLGVPLTGNFIYSSLVPTATKGMFLNISEVDPVIKGVDNYKYFEELSCVYHMKSGKETQNCALVASNRYAYSLLEVLTLSNDVPVAMGHHYPCSGAEDEKNRRLDMLRRWGVTDFEEVMEFSTPADHVEDDGARGRDSFDRRQRRDDGDQGEGQDGFRRQRYGGPRRQRRDDGDQGEEQDGSRQQRYGPRRQRRDDGDQGEEQDGFRRQRNGPRRQRRDDGDQGEGQDGFRGQRNGPRRQPRDDGDQGEGQDSFRGQRRDYGDQGEGQNGFRGQRHGPRRQRRNDGDQGEEQDGSLGRQRRDDGDQGKEQDGFRRQRSDDGDQREKPEYVWTRDPDAETPPPVPYSTEVPDIFLSPKPGSQN